MKNKEENTEGGLVFVSYSHQDKAWLRRFLTVSKPLVRYAGVDVWSDEGIKAGDKWRGEIDKAMERAVVAVLLVSVNLLDSDFVADVELPYILAAARNRKLEILLVQLTPCYLKATPLADIQFAAGMPTPLNALTEYEWMKALCGVCEQIDAVIRGIERPMINRSLQNRTVERQERNLQVLAKPAIRETEVLVYPGDGNWYTQSRIARGSTTGNCWFGTERTKPGTSFRIIAITTDDRLTPGSKHASLPTSRTKSEEVIVRRI